MPNFFIDDRRLFVPERELTNDDMEPESRDRVFPLDSLLYVTIQSFRVTDVPLDLNTGEHFWFTRGILRFKSHTHYTPEMRKHIVMGRAQKVDSSAWAYGVVPVDWNTRDQGALDADVAWEIIDVRQRLLLKTRWERLLEDRG